MIPFYQSENIRCHQNVKHGFFGRRGGVSSGIYKSLNTILNCGDNPQYVTENRSRICKTLERKLDYFRVVKQVHGSKVHTILSANESLDGVTADALVTNCKGIIIAVQTADCVPILLTDGKVVGACHAGWKGLTQGIIQNTILAMKKLGSCPESITACIGPCIHQESYEFSNNLKTHFKNPEQFFKPGKPGHCYLDMVGYAKFCLESYGIKGSDHININTFTNPKLFFSCRYTKINSGGEIFGDQSSCISLD